jgi:adenosylmethionine-8-amino-7-oxononanoate aminotransferase
MTGMGRTGKNFAVEHWNVEPDMILVGKGVASGYAPLGGVLVSGEIVQTMAEQGGVFEHGFTYSAHPVAMAAGLAVLDYIERNHLFERVAPAGQELRHALEVIKQFPIVGEIRGRGLLLGIEFVQDPASRAPFPSGAQVAERVFQAALENGVLTYPIQGCVDGERGDHVLLAPPFTIGAAEIEELSKALWRAVKRMSCKLLCR